MRLTPTELDRLTIFTAAELARRRRAKGWKLNAPRGARHHLRRDARGGARRRLLRGGHARRPERRSAADDVLDGVRRADRHGQDRVPLRRRHAGAPRRAARSGAGRGGGERRDEARRDPPRRRADRPQRGPAHRRGRRSRTPPTTPIFVSSHFPFFEVNRRLSFDRAQAWGMHLDVPAGDSVALAAGRDASASGWSPSAGGGSCAASTA